MQARDLEGRQGPQSDRGTTLRVLGIAGSLRRGSFNQALLRAAQELAPEGMEIRVFERLEEIPPFSVDREAEGDPAPVTELKEGIHAAGALLVVTPEYNFGIPGVLKNALDWASRPPRDSALIDKPTGIMGASPGMIGTARAQMQLRQVLVFTRTPVLPYPEVLVARAGEKFDAEGRLTDEPTRTQVRRHLEALAAWARRLQVG